MRKTPLRKISEKQKEKLKVWRDVTIERANQLKEKYNVVICEYCGKPAGDSELFTLGGHHIDRNRRHNTIENCYLCHYVCHGYIHDHNVLVFQEDFDLVPRELFY